ncbi:MAG: ATP-binding protein [Kiloniellaceae bacterium]
MTDGVEMILLPAWLSYAAAGVCLAAVVLIAALILLLLRQTGQFAALTAQLSNAGDTLKRDSNASQEATQALQQQLSEALTQLRAARDKASQADRANQAKSAFLAMMSHELRTPLSAIIGFAELIEHQSMGPVGNSKYQDYACDIRQSGQHLLGIINDILDLSKVESGRETLREQTIPADELFNGIRVLLEGRPQEAGVKLVFDFPGDLPAIHADKRRLTQILVNLLSNAIKFTPAGGTVRLRCWATAGSGFVFQAIDNGVGIAREDIPVALSVFGQIDNSACEAARGTGLGLPLAKALAELHGGTLDLQSEAGKGTTVTLRMPAHRMILRQDTQATAAPGAIAG